MNSIDKYISQFDEEKQEILKKIRGIALSNLSEAQEMIKYGMPTYYYKENLIHFACMKHHIGFYPTPSVIEVFEDKLKSYKHAKGSIQFPLDKPMPYDLIEEMIRYRKNEVFKD